MSTPGLSTVKINMQLSSHFLLKFYAECVLCRMALII